MAVVSIGSMVTRENAGRVAIDATANLLAELTILPRPPSGKTRKDLLLEGAMNSALWHYALRDGVYEVLGPARTAATEAGAKAMVLAGLYALQQWSDSLPINPARAAVYGLSQGGANFVERALGY